MRDFYVHTGTGLKYRTQYFKDTLQVQMLSSSGWIDSLRNVNNANHMHKLQYTGTSSKVPVCLALISLAVLAVTNAIGMWNV